jgi:alpha-tubulin suppressor-like RCC1 family protein
MLRSLALAVLLLLSMLWASTVWAEASSSVPSQASAHTPVKSELEIGPVDQWVMEVAIGDAHTCALTGAGAVHCWGDNTHGQLGDGTTQQRDAPVEVTGLPSGVSAIASGPAYTCAAASPFVWCWGAVLVQGQEEIWLSPRQVDYDANIVALTAGTKRSMPWQATGHTCALTRDGAVLCWGSNDNGQLGNGTIVAADAPVLVSEIDKGATAVAAGNHHTCALVVGGVQCWGWNGLRQLGDGTDADSR